MNITYAIGMHEIDIIAYSANDYELIHNHRIIAIENNLKSSINFAHKYLENYIISYKRMMNGEFIAEDYVEGYEDIDC